MSKGFTENTRVQVPAALHLCRLGYTYLDKIDPEDYDCETNILVSVFKESVKRLNPFASDGSIETLMSSLRRSLGNDDLGREFYNKVTATSGLKIIDFDNPDNNVWHCTTELPCENPDTGDSFRPDITCFVNGLPLAFIEVKIPNNREGMLAERERMDRRMSRECFRRFLNATQVMIFSNNQEYDRESTVPIQGAFYATIAKEHVFFNLFREEDDALLVDAGYAEVDDDVEKKILRHRHCLHIKDDPAYVTNKKPERPTNRLVTSILSKRRFLFILKYALVYVDRKVEIEGGEVVTRLEKHIMRYQQLFATFALRKRLDGGGKGGIIWHTQGSGKTAFAYYNAMFLRDYYAAKQTAAKFFFIVDRLDLLEQAADEFSSRGLMVQKVDSREGLMKRIRDEKPCYNPLGLPEITVVNIQKFKEDHHAIKLESAYSINLQRVFFVDEAHRGYKFDGSFLANLMEADRDAVKVALTGTPLLDTESATKRVFGDYIHTYYYDKSIADGYTLKIMRDEISSEYRETIINKMEEIAREVKVKKGDIDDDDIIEHDSFINGLLDYIIPDFRRFRAMMDCMQAGGMIVCKTNEQARKLHEAFTKRIADEWLPTGIKRLTSALILHDEGGKEVRKTLITDFKKKENIDILIVNAMLLTGFDAPRLKRLYLCKKMKDHALLQALTRVNRTFKDFRYGYIVDFAGIKENFIQTNNRYIEELRNLGDENQPSIVDTLMVSPEEVKERLEEIKSALFPYDLKNKEEFRMQLDEEQDRAKLTDLRSALVDAKALANQVRASGDDELKALLDELSPEDVPALLSEVNHRIRTMDALVDFDHEQDVSEVLNEALTLIEFNFKLVKSEELVFVYNQLRDRMEEVIRERDRNFDKKEGEFVALDKALRDFLFKQGYRVRNVEEANAALKVVEDLGRHFRDLNRRNNMLKRQYGEDERFVRIHKRIMEENATREQPVISKDASKVCTNLNGIRGAVNEVVEDNETVLENRAVFETDVMRAVSIILREGHVESTSDDRRFIRNKIVEEYAPDEVA